VNILEVNMPKGRTRQQQKEAQNPNKKIDCFKIEEYYSFFDLLFFTYRGIVHNQIKGMTNKGLQKIDVLTKSRLKELPVALHVLCDLSQQYLTTEGKEVTLVVFKALLKHTPINLLHLGMTPLMLSCRTGAHDFVLLLVEQLIAHKMPLDLKSKDENPCTAIEHAILYFIKEPSQEKRAAALNTIEYLLSKIAVPNFLNITMMGGLFMNTMARTNNTGLLQDVKLVSLLIKYKAVDVSANFGGDKLFMIAAEHQSKEFLTVVQAETINIFATNDQGEGIISALCCAKMPVVENIEHFFTHVSSVIEKIEDAKERNKKLELFQTDKDHALIKAFALGHEAMVNLLLSHNANILFVSPVIGCSVLVMAAKLGHFKILHMLLQKLKGNSAAQEQKNIALWKAIAFCQPAIVVLLLEHGADPNAQKEFCSGALVYAVGLYGKACEKQNGPEKTASKENAYLIIKHLLTPRYNTALNQLGYGNNTLLHLACATGNLDLVTLLMGAGILNSGIKIDSPNIYNHTALLFSVCLGHIDIVDFLLSRGASPIKLSTNGSSPLFHMIRQNNIPMLESVFKHTKTDINGVCALDTDGTPLSPLMVAGAYGVGTFDYLLSKGADIDLEFNGSGHKNTVFWTARNDCACRLFSITIDKECKLAQQPLHPKGRDAFIEWLIKNKDLTNDSRGNIFIPSVNLFPVGQKNKFIEEWEKIEIPRTEFPEVVARFEEALNEDGSLEDALAANIVLNLHPGYHQFQISELNESRLYALKELQTKLQNNYKQFTLLENELKKQADATQEKLEEMAEILESLKLLTASNDNQASLESKFKNLDKLKQALELKQLAVLELHDVLTEAYHQVNYQLTENIHLDWGNRRVRKALLPQATDDLNKQQASFLKLQEFHKDLISFSEDLDKTLSDLVKSEERHKKHLATKKNKRDNPRTSFALKLEQRENQNAQARREHAEKMDLLKKEGEKRKEAWNKKRAEEKQKRADDFKKLTKLREAASLQNKSLESADTIVAPATDVTATNAATTTTTTSMAHSSKAPPAAQLLYAWVPLSAQTEIGPEIESLRRVLRELYDNSKSEHAQDFISVEIARRALLGVSARIMELIAQRNLSTLISTETARNFRNALYHRNVIPPVNEENIQGALKFNTKIYDMALKLNDLLTANQKIENANLLEIMKETEFSKIVAAAEVKEATEEAAINEQLKKEKFILSCIEGYQKAAGHYAKYPELMMHAIGFTTGLTTALEALKRDLGLSFDGSRMEAGKKYRHAKA